MGRSTWTDKEEKFVRKNIHLTNAELADKLGKSLASVENKVRELGLARTFQKHEVEILKQVWGKRRAVIVRALPRFTWKQINKKANHLGLPSIKDAREAVNLYTILNAMGEGDSVGKRWIEAGLSVTNDKLKHMKNNILMVEIDDFWNFAMEHPDVVDITKLGDNVFDVLGVPPPELKEMRVDAKPLEKRIKHKRLSVARRKELATEFYSSDLPTEVIASNAGVAVDTLRRIASKYKQDGQVRKRASVVTDDFLRKLDQLYYTEGKSYAECAEALNCSKSSISRGVLQLVKNNKRTSQ